MGSGHGDDKTVSKWWFVVSRMTDYSLRAG